MLAALASSWLNISLWQAMGGPFVFILMVSKIAEVALSILLAWVRYPQERRSLQTGLIGFPYKKMTPA